MVSSATAKNIERARSELDRLTLDGARLARILDYLSKRLWLTEAIRRAAMTLVGWAVLPWVLRLDWFGIDRGSEVGHAALAFGYPVWGLCCVLWVVALVTSWNHCQLLDSRFNAMPLGERRDEVLRISQEAIQRQYSGKRI